MKNNTQPALKERIEKALEDFTKGRASMHVPPLDTDVDVVLAECSDRLSELEARCAALAAESAAMHETIEAVRSVADNSSGIAGWHLNGDIATWEEILPEINEIETPATDAFLAEVRAAAVDEVCLKISNAIVNCYQDEQVGLDEAATICGDFAAQLRKGGATEERQSFLSDEDCQAFVKAFTKGAAQ